ncbi:MAG: XTP/dITP diphosphatase [Eubacteriales bacterium]
MKIVLASRNAHKIAELRDLLTQLTGKELEILSLDDIGYTGEIEENGSSFEENALIKAGVPASLGYMGIADDSGLSVDALDGAPGIYSARYAGEPCDNARNNEKLLENLKNVPKEERTAKFVCVIAAVSPSGEQMVVRGECPGEILTELHGDGGFGYDPLFYYPPAGKTFAELSASEKNTVSHRAVAMKGFAAEFVRFMEKYGTNS